MNAKCPFCTKNLVIGHAEIENNKFLSLSCESCHFSQVVNDNSYLEAKIKEVAIRLEQSELLD